MLNPIIGRVNHVISPEKLGGVLPNISIQPTIEDIFDAREPVMKRAFELIEEVNS